MNKITASIAAAALLVGGLVTTSAATASAADIDPQGCTETVTVTEHRYKLQEYKITEPATYETVPAALPLPWYTELDDRAPVVTDTGVTFLKEEAGAPAIGLRYPTSQILDDTFTASWTGTLGTAYTHLRLVVDDPNAPYDPALPANPVSNNWRDDYQSLNVTSLGQSVDKDSVVWVSGANVSMTLGDYILANPGEVITSIGFHVDTNAPAGTSATVLSASFADLGIIPEHLVKVTPDVYGWVPVPGTLVWAETTPEAAEGFRYNLHPEKVREVEKTVEVPCPYVPVDPFLNDDIEAPVHGVVNVSCKSDMRLDITFDIEPEEPFEFDVYINGAFLKTLVDDDTDLRGFHPVIPAAELPATNYEWSVIARYGDEAFGPKTGSVSDCPVVTTPPVEPTETPEPTVTPEPTETVEPTVTPTETVAPVTLTTDRLAETGVSNWIPIFGVGSIALLAIGAGVLLRERARNRNNS